MSGYLVTTSCLLYFCHQLESMEHSFRSKMPIPSLRAHLITTFKRHNPFPPTLAQQKKYLALSFSSINSTSIPTRLPTTSLTIFQQTTSSTIICKKALDTISLKTFYSDSKWYSNKVGDSSSWVAGAVNERSRFKEIPVHPSILRYIKNIGVGREGKENRRKRRPFKKKRERSNVSSASFGERKIRGGFDTMNREEERLLLGNGQMSRRSGAARQHRRYEQSFVPVHKLAPPPFGDGQGQLVSHTTNDGGNIECISTMQEQQRRIRILPVRVLGSVDGDETGSHIFPRPSSGLPEVAIIGRSNVGKSTLLNALLYSGQSIEKEESEVTIRRRNKRFQSRMVSSRTARLPRGVKAKTSSKPGETRSISFYQLSAVIEESCSNENKKSKDTIRPVFDYKNRQNHDDTKRKYKKSLLLVDLPGYGFAFGPKKQREHFQADSSHGSDEKSSPEFMFSWQLLIQTYITSRPRSSLKRILLLIDARHGMKRADFRFLDMLQMALIKQQRRSSKALNDQQQRIPMELPPLQIVLTKCDLVTQVDLARRVVQVRQQLSDCLLRQPKLLPEMLVSAQIEGQRGVLELQKELASLCSVNFQ